VKFEESNENISMEPKLKCYIVAVQLENEFKDFPGLNNLLNNFNYIR
jgi:hypothetical protein